MGKLKPTAKMLEFRKKVELERQKQNQANQDYWADANVEKSALKKKRDRLESDRDLAAEALIGYGLAVKSMEEKLRELDKKITESELQIQKNAPRYYSGDKFKIEFGVSEYEVDWSVPTKETK